MTAAIPTLLASFTTPIQIDTNPVSMLWLPPLVVAIAVVYKATKVHKIGARSFTKENASASSSMKELIRHTDSAILYQTIYHLLM